MGTYHWLPRVVRAIYKSSWRASLNYQSVASIWTGMFLHPVMCPAVHVVPDGISLFRLSHSSYSFSSSGRRVDGDKAGADIESLKKQLLIVDQRLATLTGRLEVLKAVQQVLPAGKPFSEKNKTNKNKNKKKKQIICMLAMYYKSFPPW